MAQLTSEKELEKYLFNLEGEYCDHPLGVVGKCFSQVEVKGYGIADLLYVDISSGGTPHSFVPEITIEIVELKKGAIDYNAVGQICRYKTGIQRLLDRSILTKNKKRHLFKYTIYGTLVGLEVGNGDVRYTIDHMGWLSCFTYELDLSEGISFKKRSDWYSPSENLELRVTDDTKKEFYLALRQSIKEFKDINSLQKLPRYGDEDYPF